MKSPLVRCAKNPILTPAMMPFDCYTVMNAGATRFEGDVLLLLILLFLFLEGDDMELVITLALVLLLGLS